MRLVITRLRNSCALVIWSICTGQAFHDFSRRSVWSSWLG